MIVKQLKKRPKGEDALLAAALKYAAHGVRVFPIARGKKTPPCIKRWQVRATTDAKQIRKWWKEFPGSNVGIATGVDSGLIVIDVDCHESDGFAALRDLEARYHKLPITLAAKTPSGGRHFYFATNARFKNSASKLGQGIDVRAERGYVVAVPSVVKEGSYVWEN